MYSVNSLGLRTLILLSLINIVHLDQPVLASCKQYSSYGWTFNKTTKTRSTDMLGKHISCSNQDSHFESYEGPEFNVRSFICKADNCSDKYDLNVSYLSINKNDFVLGKIKYRGQFKQNRTCVETKDTQIKYCWNQGKGLEW